MNLINKDQILFCAIVDFGKGSKIVKEAKKIGATGGTLFLGKGTISNQLLDVLGIHEARKEILIIVADQDLENTLYKGINKKFHLDKPHHGIVFSIPVNKIFGFKHSKDMKNSKNMEVDTVEYQAIFTIVDKGLSDKVIDSAKSAGATGGTIIHGRGSGTSDKALLFNIEIEPEKEIVLILSQIINTDSITSSIRKDLQIDKPGKGIIFVLDVSRTLGLFDHNIEKID